MFLQVHQFIVWMVIMACILQIQASKKDKCLREKVHKQESRESLSSNSDSETESEQKCNRPICPSLKCVLKVDDLEGDNWEMVFRATAGNGHNAFDAWTNGTDACDNKPTTMERSLSCHYRSDKVSLWSNLQIDQVKIAFYSQCREVAYVVFNGTDTDLFTWFDKSRVVSSSYSDLTSSNAFNIFSVVGDYRINHLDRRFFINRVYRGCTKDFGHLLTVDTRTVRGCPCDIHVVYPQFLYSEINAADIWNNNRYGRAQYMAIFIKTQ